jgi:uncharacterized protein
MPAAAVIIAAILVLYLFFSWFIGRLMARKFAFARVHSLEKTYSDSIEEGNFTEEEFASYHFQPFSLTSRYGYELRGVFSPGSDPTKSVIFVHGHTWSWHGMVKYMPPYRERGYNIIAYNHRYHGDSGGSCCTAGFFEKHDLKQVADWVFEKFPDTKVLGAAGESLGAATVMQFMPLEKRLTFAHADCPYSDTLDLYRHMLRRNHVPRFMDGITLFFCDRYLRRACGFGLTDTVPIRSVMESPVPLFLVHGTEDTYVPTKMSVETAEKRSGTYPTVLLLIEGAAHAKALVTARKQYFSSLNAFLDSAESGVFGDWDSASQPVLQPAGCLKERGPVMDDVLPAGNS